MSLNCDHESCKCFEKSHKEWREHTEDFMDELSSKYDALLKDLMIGIEREIPAVKGKSLEKLWVGMHAIATAADFFYQDLISMSLHVKLKCDLHNKFAENLIKEIEDAKYKQ